MEDIFTLNEVKSLILLKTGIRTITPADCKRISIEISKTLNKNVSETTIKRLFGFAVVKHNFSKFTLTTLAEYVNKEDERNWTPTLSSSTQSQVHTWSDIRSHAKKITNFTLKGIKNRSGIPYEMTISRKFAEHDFEDFMKSDYSYTCFISQPGYGRTILLSHLVENFFQAETAIHLDSTVLFLTASNIFNPDQHHLSFEDRLKIQLGIPHQESLLEHIQKNHIDRGRKFIVVIDGFSEVMVKGDLKKQMFENIISFICSIEHNDAIKLVMSMRTTTWMRFYDCIRHSAFLKSKWFPGNYYNPDEVSNVPPLTGKEIDRIIHMINKSDDHELNTKLKSQLKFPLYIQLYYQLKEEDPYFNYSSSITFHELISRFIQEKIYKSNYYTEKILFLKKVIQLTEYGKKADAVPKDLLIAELSAFKNAYMELVSEGILVEEKSQDDYQPREYVRFIYPHIFEYFLFIELLEKFHLQVNWTFFEFIQRNYENNNVRFHLLQWTVRFIIRIGDFSALTHVFDLDLHHFERNYLILFIAENIQFRARYSPDTHKLLAQHKLHDILIKQLINFDFIDSCYKEAITVLADVADNEEQQVIYQSILAIFDVMSMDQDSIALRLTKIAAMDLTAWSINPYEVCWLIYLKLSNRADLSHPLIQDLEKLRYSFAENRVAIDTKQGISYLMLILLNTFYGTDEGTIKIIQAITKQHPRIFSKRSPFPIFIMNIYGIACSKLNPGKKTDQMERILTEIHRNKSRFKLTEYSECIFMMMQANQLRLRGEFVKAYEYSYETLQVFKRNELNLNCIMIYDIMIAIFQDLNDMVKVNEYKYERLCFMEERKIPHRLLVTVG
ncbi:NACHT domain-containing protein [Pedobacter gandavensis]|uniref:NACHT domain-containing protein n=1 Tax=Pedobacter gandavensis TaxID=2679963 RepID=A0ABR6EXL1_9SPHI|nr:hypothetical protein [Pedobacter gandavensis]MBB2149772.1 hypothetical protein [Pedobacter gandavensis]